MAKTGVEDLAALVVYDLPMTQMKSGIILANPRLSANPERNKVGIIFTQKIFCFHHYSCAHESTKYELKRQ